MALANLDREEEAIAAYKVLILYDIAAAPYARYFLDHGLLSCAVAPGYLGERSVFDAICFVQETGHQVAYKFAYIRSSPNKFQSQHETCGTVTITAQTSSK